MVRFPFLEQGKARLVEPPFDLGVFASQQPGKDDPFFFQKSRLFDQFPHDRKVQIGK